MATAALFLYLVGDDATLLSMGASTPYFTFAASCSTQCTKVLWSVSPSKRLLHKAWIYQCTSYDHIIALGLDELLFLVCVLLIYRHLGNGLCKSTHDTMISSQLTWVYLIQSLSPICIHPTHNSSCTCSLLELMKFLELMNCGLPVAIYRLPARLLCISSANFFQVASVM